MQPTSSSQHVSPAAMASTDAVRKPPQCGTSSGHSLRMWSVSRATRLQLRSVREAAGAGVQGRRGLQLVQVVRDGRQVAQLDREQLCCGGLAPARSQRLARVQRWQPVTHDKHKRKVTNTLDGEQTAAIHVLLSLAPDPADERTLVTCRGCHRSKVTT